MDDILTIEEIKQFLEETNTPIIAEYNSSNERNQPIDSFDIIETSWLLWRRIYKILQGSLIGKA